MLSPKQVQPNDVLLGRGSGPNDHPGNISYRKDIRECLKEFLSSYGKERAVIVERVLRSVRKRKGRFLRKVTNKELRTGLLTGVAASSKSQGEASSKSFTTESSVTDTVPSSYFVEINDDAVISEKVTQAFRYFSRNKDEEDRSDQTSSSDPVQKSPPRKRKRIQRVQPAAAAPADADPILPAPHPLAETDLASRLGVANRALERLLMPSSALAPAPLLESQVQTSPLLESLLNLPAPSSPIRQINAASARASQPNQVAILSQLVQARARQEAINVLSTNNGRLHESLLATLQPGSHVGSVQSSASDHPNPFQVPSSALQSLLSSQLLLNNPTTTSQLFQPSLFSNSLLAQQLILRQHQLRTTTEANAASSLLDLLSAASRANNNTEASISGGTVPNPDGSTTSLLERLSSAAASRHPASQWNPAGLATAGLGPPSILQLLSEPSIHGAGSGMPAAAAGAESPQEETKDPAARKQSTSLAGASSSSSSSSSSSDDHSPPATKDQSQQTTLNKDSTSSEE